MEAWTLGWDALVAIGTLLLAVATVWLAGTTRAVARATRDEQAATWRPLLVFHHLEMSGSVDKDDASLSIRVRNDGRGPALNVRARIEVAGPPASEASMVGIIPVGLHYAFPRRVPRDQQNFVMLLDYDDIGGRSYSTAMRVIPNRLPGFRIRTAGEDGVWNVSGGRVMTARFYSDRRIIRRRDGAAAEPPLDGGLPGDEPASSVVRLTVDVQRRTEDGGDEPIG